MGQKIEPNIIALDSMIFIYHFEKSRHFFARTQRIFRDIEKGKNIGLASVITLLEILTLPKKEKNHFLVKEYLETLKNFPNLRFVEVDWQIADLASSLRAKYNLTSPDAIQIATALANNADYFVTADKVFKKVKEIKVKLLKIER